MQFQPVKDAAVWQYLLFDYNIKIEITIYSNLENQSFDLVRRLL